MCHLWSKPWGLRCTSSAAAADEHCIPLQEYIANKLQKQADRLGTEKAALLKEKSDLQRQAWPSIQLCFTSGASGLHCCRAWSPWANLIVKGPPLCIFTIRLASPVLYICQCTVLLYFLLDHTPPVALPVDVRGIVGTIAGACVCLPSPRKLCVHGNLCP